jgi:hypothetical protein
MYLNRSNDSVESGSLERVEIRPTSPTDADELERLRQLDSHPALGGVALVAEVEGRLLAAISASGEVIADPFRRTAEAVELLRLRARQLGRHDRSAANHVFATRTRRLAASLRLHQAAG